MILALNTTVNQFSLALMKTGGEILSELLLAPGQGRYTSLMPALRSLFEMSGKSLKDLEAVILARGPGSFTGLRVGMALAKGLAHGLRINIISVSSLAALAGQLPHTSCPICPVIYSRREEVFAALFRWEDEKGLKELIPLRCLRLDSFESFIDQPTLFIGHDYQKQAPLLRQTLKEKVRLAPPHLWVLTASTVGALGLERFHRNDFDDLNTLTPFYMRPPDIRPNYPLQSEQSH
jgi:tRNA threonylcarbamoyladenosine biosynthesis protein TsaB